MEHIQYSLTILSSRSLVDRLETASLNTIIGMGTVFIVLILSIFLISLFKYIPRLEERFTHKPKITQKPPVDEFFTQIEEQEKETVMNQDAELVAVITAAIQASMGDTTPKDGFVVRSIRKVAKTR